MNPRVALKEAGLSLSDLAAQLGVTPSTVSRWFAGRFAVPLDKAAQIERLTAGRVTMVALAGLVGAQRPAENPAPPEAA